MYLPSRSGECVLGVGMVATSVRNRDGAKGQGFLEAGAGTGSGAVRFAAQKAWGENKRPEGKKVGSRGFGGLGGSSEASCRGPIPQKLAAVNA